MKLKLHVTVGSLINWLRPYTSEMFVRKEQIKAFASGSKLQLTSLSKYSSLFSASILVIKFSNLPKKSVGELGS